MGKQRIMHSAKESIRTGKLKYLRSPAELILQQIDSCHGGLTYAKTRLQLFNHTSSIVCIQFKINASLYTNNFKFYFRGSKECVDSVFSRSNYLKIMTSPPEVIKMRNVVYFPEEKLGNAVNFGCLYDNQFRKIKESCTFKVVQGEKKNVTLSPPNRAFDRTTNTDKRKFVYLGPLATHYGHFLIDAVARLWYLTAAIQEERTLLVHGSRTHFKLNYIRDFFSYLNIDTDDLVTLEKPTVLNDVSLPCPTFLDGGVAYQAHSKLFHNVAENCLSDTAVNKTAQPLYLSRSHLKKRKHRNERLLEKILMDKGIRIVHPESLSLQEQIKLINEHEVIIGIQGSALHNLLFRLEPAVTITLCDLPYGNYLAIDTMQQNEAHYIKCCHLALSLKTGRERCRKINIGIACDALRQIGVL